MKKRLSYVAGVKKTMLEIDDFFNETYIKMEKEAKSWFLDLVEFSGKTTEEIKATKGGMIESLIEAFNRFYMDALLESISEIESIRFEMSEIWSNCNSNIKDFLVEHKDVFLKDQLIHKNSAKIMKEMCSKRKESIKYDQGNYSHAGTTKVMPTDRNISSKTTVREENLRSNLTGFSSAERTYIGIYTYIPGFYEARSIEEALGLIDAFYNTDNLPTQKMIQEKMERIMFLSDKLPSRLKDSTDSRLRKLAEKTFENFIKTNE